MPELAHALYSYREDPGVPAFDDSRALFVFDGVCVLCSSGAAFVMRHDRHARVNFTPVRSTLGQALYRHYAVVSGTRLTRWSAGGGAPMRWPARGIGGCAPRSRMAVLAGGRHRARTVARCGLCAGRAQSLPLVRHSRYTARRLDVPESSARGRSDAGQHLARSLSPARLSGTPCGW